MILLGCICGCGFVFPEHMLIMVDRKQKGKEVNLFSNFHGWIEKAITNLEPHFLEQTFSNKKPTHRAHQ